MANNNTLKLTVVPIYSTTIHISTYYDPSEVSLEQLLAGHKVSFMRTERQFTAEEIEGEWRAVYGDGVTFVRGDGEPLTYAEALELNVPSAELCQG